MSDSWKQWEGQVVDHKYQLQRYLGSADHSVVFLAEFHDPAPRKAAIKFVSADVTNREQQIAVWNNAAKLDHPNLIRIYGGGLCRIEQMDLLYVAMEFAEENLAQVLPHRALMVGETNEMLNAIVDVLVYLHGKNLTHGHIKPSNVLANGEMLKLSSDTIFLVGETREMRRERSAYDAPELPDSEYTPAADVWSLGVTLVEAFTQQPAVLPFNERADPIIPSGIREPFLEVVRRSLQREPKLRWSSAEISAHLNPAAAARSVAAGAGTSARSAVASETPVAVATTTATPAPPMLSPLHVPLSNEPAIPLAKQPPVPAPRATVARSALREEGIPPTQTVVLPNYAIPLFAGLLVVVALILLPFVLRHRGGSEASTVKTPTAPSSANAPAVVSNSAPGTPKSTKLPDAKSAPEPALATPARPQPVVPTPAPSIAPRKEPSPIAPAKNSSGAPQKGEALDQVKPEASTKALATIQGTVRVGVKVHVDTAGSVTDATLDNSGPSRYFADLSLKAARQWVFTPPETDGRSVASDWLIQYHYTHSGVEVSSQQVAP